MDVVITGIASIKADIFSVSLFAPPRWPDNVDMTNLPLSSMFIIAGSVTLDSISGEIDLIKIPDAIIAIIASYSSNKIGKFFLTFL